MSVKNKHSAVYPLPRVRVPDISVESTADRVITVFWHDEEDRKARKWQLVEKNPSCWVCKGGKGKCENKAPFAGNPLEEKEALKRFLTAKHVKHGCWKHTARGRRRKN